MKQWLNQHKFYNCPHPTFCCLLIHKSPLLPSHRVLLFGGHGKEQIPAASSLLIVSHVSGRAITLDGSTAQDWQAPGHTFSWDISRSSCVSQPRLSIRTPSTLSRGQNRVHFTESWSSLSWKAPSKGHEQEHLMSNLRISPLCCLWEEFIVEMWATRCAVPSSAWAIPIKPPCLGFQCDLIFTWACAHLSAFPSCSKRNE